MIGARATKFYIDPGRVLTPAQKASVQVRRKFGAFTRATARKALKYGDKPAGAGQPPTVHKTQTRTRINRKTGVAKTQQVSPFRENIFFDLDERQESVVIGPSLLPGKIGKAPRALEEGGPTQIWSRGTIVRATIKPHPTMGPAFAQEKEKSLSKLWAGAIK